MNCSIDNQGLSFQWDGNLTGNAQNQLQNLQGGLTSEITNAIYQYPPTGVTTCWDYWQNWYYPQVIYQSYPVYIRERAMDKGKQAFEIIKILKDKKLVNLEKVGDFIDLMDELIKIL